jgi:hypothetical protein
VPITLWHAGRDDNPAVRRQRSIDQAVARRAALASRRVVDLSGG